MAPSGFSHIGLSTLDLDRTREFFYDTGAEIPVRRLGLEDPAALRSATR